MPDAPEIPEAKDPFDKRVALSIAIIAICLSFVANLGDNAKTSAILKTSEASDQWNYFQAKSTADFGHPKCRAINVTNSLLALPSTGGDFSCASHGPLPTSCRMLTRALGFTLI